MIRAFVTTVFVIGVIWPRLSVAQATTAESHVEIVTSAIDGIFPQSWLSESFCARAEMLPASEAKRSEKVLKVALNKYPLPVLMGSLAKIYVVEKLTFSGISAGGTNSSKNVYIANKGARRGSSDQWIEKTFHSEFSSILLRNFPLCFDMDAWKAVNVDTFEYGISGVSAIEEKRASTKYDESLHVAGFLCEYSMSTLENDFNFISRELFFGDARFWLLVSENERIGEKTDLAIEFYGNVDPVFTRAFFQSFADRSNAEYRSVTEPNAE